MTSKERITAIIEGQPVDRCGFWTGSPHGDSWPGLFRHFNCKTPEEVYRKLGDDVRYMMIGGQPRMPRGYLADCDSVAKVHDFPWPNPDELDLTYWVNELKGAEGYYRISGNLSMFFHDDCFNSFGGMQQYFIKMYTDPDVVHALMRHVNDYYLRLNRRFFEEAGTAMEACYFSHDLGTQLGLMMSASMLEDFVLPYLKEQFDLGHEFGLHVCLHCCGSIRPILPRLIEMGMDLLNPIQALAAGMDAESLAEFKDQVTFVGGIDTQELLRHGSPEDVRREVGRVARLLGPLVISPSHEALLPDVPPANVEAMAAAVAEFGNLPSWRTARRTKSLPDPLEPHCTAIERALWWLPPAEELESKLPPKSATNESAAKTLAVMASRQKELPAVCRAAAKELAVSTGSSKVAKLRELLGRVEAIGAASQAYARMLASARREALKDPARPLVLLKFKASRLQAPVADIASAQPPRAGLARQAVPFTAADELADIRSFHGGADGVIYIETTVKMDRACRGELAYGSDGPVKVWVNGRAVDCRPQATNPARIGEYVTPVSWKTGVNRICFALATNYGRAWGVQARVSRGRR